LESTLGRSLLSENPARLFFGDTDIVECWPTIDGAFCAFDFTDRTERIANVDICDTAGEDQLTVSECLNIIS
jgi:hypothetical protein